MILQRTDHRKSAQRRKVRYSARRIRALEQFIGLALRDRHISQSRKAVQIAQAALPSLTLGSTR